MCMGTPRVIEIISKCMCIHVSTTIMHVYTHIYMYMYMYMYMYEKVQKAI